MDRSFIKPINTLSGSNFYEKIMTKYQTGKSKASKFPILIFFKNKEFLFHKEVDISVLLRKDFFNQNVLLPLTVISIPDVKRMLSWLGTGSNTLQSAFHLKNIHNLSSVKNFFASNSAFNQQTAHVIYSNNIMMNSQILYHKNQINILNSKTFRARTNYLKYLSYDNLFFNSIILEKNKPLFKEPNKLTVYGHLIKKFFYSLMHSSSSSIHRIHAYRTMYSGNQSILPLILLQDILFSNNKTFKMSRLFYKYLIHVTVNKPLIKNHYGSFEHISSSSVNRIDTSKTGYFGNQSKLSAISSQDNIFFKNAALEMNKFLFKYPNQIIVNEPPIKYNHNSFKNISSSSAQRTYTYKTESGIMHFQDTGYLEQEIEQIKNILLQTKESVSGNPKLTLGEAEIKRYLDINRISDQVYQNIERTIRMERERRGI